MPGRRLLRWGVVCAGCMAEATAQMAPLVRTGDAWSLHPAPLPSYRILDVLATQDHRMLAGAEGLGALVDVVTGTQLAHEGRPAAWHGHHVADLRLGARPVEALEVNLNLMAFGQCRALEQRIEEAGRTWADPAVPPHHLDRPPMAAEPADPLVPSGCARFHGYMIAWQAEDDVPRFYPAGPVDAATGVATPCVCVTEARTFFHVFVENGAPEGLVCPEGPPPWSAEEAARRAGLDLGAIERDVLMAGPD